MNGITHQVNFAPPVKNTSTEFIATSIDIIDINDIPIAVFSALTKVKSRMRIKVSSSIDVINPFIMAKIIIESTGQPIPVN